MLVTEIINITDIANLYVYVYHIDIAQLISNNNLKL